MSADDARDDRSDRIAVQRGSHASGPGSSLNRRPPAAWARTYALTSAAGADPGDGVGMFRRLTVPRQPEPVGQGIAAGWS